jgi:hypothetical protein
VSGDQAACGHSAPPVARCGDVWRFLVLRGQQALAETTTYDIREDLDRIMGILWAMSLDQIAGGGESGN